jgi:transposase InsO family protein
MDRDWSKLRRWLIRRSWKGIQLPQYVQKRRPTTIGKIEAFHKAYEVESHLFNRHWSFIRYYNYTRLHEALNYLTPAAIYFKDKKV